MESVQVIGTGAAVLTAASMIPQLVKIIREKKSEGISIFMVAVLISGLSLWIWYGCIKKDYPIIFTNIFSLILNILLIIFGIRYKIKK
ncbi:hypothetical protein BH10BAC2_BH10BAC2_39700 [soil metagenome]